MAMVGKMVVVDVVVGGVGGSEGAVVAALLTVVAAVAGREEELLMKDKLSLSFCLLSSLSTRRSWSIFFSDNTW